MNPKLNEALQHQIREEFYSAYLYLSMAADMAARNLNGMAAWLEAQAQEELAHAMKIYRFLLDRGQPIMLQEIPAPPSHWERPLEAFRDAYHHEQHITKKIHELVDLAREVDDKPTQVFLQWFVEEQVEEEASTEEVVALLEMAGEDGAALLLVDQKLGQRADA